LLDAVTHCIENIFDPINYINSDFIIRYIKLMYSNLVPCLLIRSEDFNRCQELSALFIYCCWMLYWYYPYVHVFNYIEESVFSVFCIEWLVICTHGFKMITTLHWTFLCFLQLLHTILNFLRLESFGYLRAIIGCNILLRKLCLMS